MIAATVSAPSTTRTRAGVRMVDLCWLAWRQYRMLIIITAVGVAGLAGYLLYLSTQTSGLTLGFIDDANLTSALNSMQTVDRIQTTLNFGVPALAGVAAVFWGAPLLAREFEQRTHLLVWAQDVTPIRWLTTRIGLLAGLLIVLAVGLEEAVHVLLSGAAKSGGSLVDQFGSLSIAGFETTIPLQIGYTLFGFTLGIALGALMRRTVPAMALSLAGFALIRWLLAFFGREHYETPIHEVDPLPSNGPKLDAASVLTTGYYNADGATVNIPNSCYEAAVGQTSEQVSNAQFDACARSHGVVSSFYDYQPQSRVPTFQLIEFGIYVVLIAVCVVTAYWSVRRRRQI